MVTLQLGGGNSSELLQLKHTGATGTTGTEVGSVLLLVVNKGHKGTPATRAEHTGGGRGMMVLGEGALGVRCTEMHG